VAKRSLQLATARDNPEQLKIVGCAKFSIRIFKTEQNNNIKAHREIVAKRSLQLATARDNPEQLKIVGADGVSSWQLQGIIPNN
jgi:hypothetical protein